MNDFVYYGLFLSDSTKDLLLNYLKSIDKYNELLDKADNIMLDHCVLLHRTQKNHYDLINKLEILKDSTFKISLNHIGYNDNAFAFQVDTLTIPCACHSPHITIATFNDGLPINSHINVVSDWEEIEPIIIEVTLKKVQF